MSQVSIFFEALYTHFLLRDIVAKAVPGAAVIIVAIYVLLPDGPAIIGSIADSNIHWIILVGVGFALGLTAGMFLQVLGESTGWIKIDVWDGTPGKSRKTVSIERDIEFQELAAKHLSFLRKRERLVVFKEMSGNYSLAIIAFILAVLLKSWVDESLPFSLDIKSTPLLLIPLTAYVLKRQNRSHAAEQQQWEALVISELKAARATHSEFE